MAYPATTDTHQHNRILAWAPLGLLAAMVAVAAALLLVPVKMPIGAMYWDVLLYLDATQRITNGQIPAVDFFAPVGALGYYLAAATIKLFSSGQPVLAVSWSIMVVTVPLMALIAFDTAKRHPLTALVLTIPFVIFTLLPFNTTISYTFPGSDAFGIYNRQTSQLLYVVVAAALFVRSQWRLALIIAVAMTALFFLKITGFLAAGLVCLLALLTGRIRLPATAAAITVFVFIVALAELSMRAMVTAYLADVATLIAMNQDGLAQRMVQSASKTVGTTLSVGILGLVIFAATWPSTRRALAGKRWAQTLDHPSIWLATVLLAGLFFESQNTGGQELVYLWPVIVMIVAAIQFPGPRPAITGITLVLAACAVLPPTVGTIQAALRSSVGALIQQPLALTQLRQMGNVTIRPPMAERATALRQLYIDYPDVLQAYSDAKQLPSFQLLSDFDFQWLNHQTTDEVVARLKGLEADGLNYDTIMALNFSNPFAWLLNKDAPKHIAIGADPNRAVPPLDTETADAVADADIVLIPLCPFAHNSAQLMAHYSAPLASHRRASLTPCYDALVHPRITFTF